MGITALILSLSKYCPNLLIGTVGASYDPCIDGSLGFVGLLGPLAIESR